MPPLLLYTGVCKRALIMFPHSPPSPSFVPPFGHIGHCQRERKRPRLSLWESSMQSASAFPPPLLRSSSSQILLLLLTLTTHWALRRAATASRGNYSSASHHHAAQVERMTCVKDGYVRVYGRTDALGFVRRRIRKTEQKESYCAFLDIGMWCLNGPIPFCPFLRFVLPQGSFLPSASLSLFFYLLLQP